MNNRFGIIGINGYVCPIDIFYVCKQLRLIKTACEDYDSDAAYSVLDQLKEKQWKPATAAALEEIRNALFLHSDFDAAAEQAEALCSEYEKPLEPA